MQRGSTHFLRFVIFVMGAAALAFCIFALPSIWKGGSEEFPTASRALFLIIASLYAMAVPFFAVLWQTLRLLRHIDENKAFSDLSLRALRNIKRSAIIITVLLMIDVPLLIPIAEADDAPGLVLMGLIVACAPIAVAVFAATLERLSRNAMDIKSENDLTV